MLTMAVVPATACRGSLNPRSIKVENFEAFAVVVRVKRVRIQMTNFKFSKVLKKLLRQFAGKTFEILA